MEYYDKVTFLNLLSENVKKFRQINNLTQKELARGICSQAQISNLENQVDVPSAFILYKICKRLGISLELLIDDSTSEYYNEIKLFQHKMEELIDSSNYDELNDFTDKKKQLLLNGNDESKILYYLAKMSYYNMKASLKVSLTKAEYDIVLSLFDKVTKLELKSYPDLELKIYVIMIGINIRMYTFDNSKAFILKGLELVNKVNERLFYKTIIRFYLNVAIVNNYLGDYDLGNYYAQKSIDLCKKHKTSVGLDSAYIIMGYQHNPKKGTGNLNTSPVNYEMCDYYYNKAINVCELFDNHSKADAYREQMLSNKKNRA